MRKKQDMLAAMLPPPPCACQFCWNDKQGIYTSIPVYLVIPDGKYVELGFRAQCPCCGHVKRYDNGVLYRLNGKVADFRHIPYPDNSFYLAVFDPPHLVRAGKKSWLAAKYGKLSQNWREDLRAGFNECMRVLKPYGTLVFKWNEDQVKLNEVLKCFPSSPLFGQKRAKTHFLVFMKMEAEK